MAGQKTTSIKIVGFSPNLRRKIGLLLGQSKHEFLTFAGCAGVSTSQALNSIWVVNADPRTGPIVDYLKAVIKQSKESAPIFWLPEPRSQTAFSYKLLRGWLDLYGATVFEGPNGFEELAGYLAHTAVRQPGEVIVNLRLSDDGLHVSFADGAHAKIPFTAVKRLAEAESIVWDTIRISRDRTFISLSINNRVSVPIPHDVLREYVIEARPGRISATKKQRRLTAQSLGRRLKSVREKQGFTQEDLAASAQSSRWTIIRIEQGSYLPKLSLLERISRALNMQVNELLPS